VTTLDSKTSLLQALKELIVEECEKEVLAESIGDDEQLFEAPLSLDSLDALQLCMAVKRVYDVRIEGNTAARKALKSVNTLADTILKKSPCFVPHS